MVNIDDIYHVGSCRRVTHQKGQQNFDSIDSISGHTRQPLLVPYFYGKMLRARGKQKNETLQVLELHHHDEESPTSLRRPRRKLRQQRITDRNCHRWGEEGITSTDTCFHFIIGCLCFAVALEIGYIISLGAFSNGDFWRFLIRTTTTKIPVRTSQQNPPIDNYYSRPHIRDPVPLIVGGSDGSGTRAFAQILEHLGVPILVEDRGTMDVHAKEMYNGAGWPALVSRVFNVTRSASFDLKDIPDPLLQSARDEVGKFVTSLKFAGSALVTAGLGKTWATSVSWAFKAPVSILLLPLFREKLPAMKVLHIVRDGRDVALSDNHSPVQKFYSYFYADAEARHKSLLLEGEDEEQQFNQNARTNIKAMQLWNDWNKQVYEYGVRYSDGKTLDVLVMRTEDLMRYPLESVVLLADFVGSMKTSHQLCCLSRMSATDLGHSGGTPFEDRFEPGDEGLGGGLRMMDPNDFSQIRSRFVENLKLNPPKQTTAEKAKDDEDESNNRRRLLENGHEAEDAVNLFESGGKVASMNHPVHLLHLQNPDGQQQQQQQQLHDNGAMAHPGFAQVAQMQHLLQQRRVNARKSLEAPETTDQVKMRYGKWVKALREDPLLSDRLHKEGRDALAMFGYEPTREFMDIYPNPELLPTCDTTVTCTVPL